MEGSQTTQGPVPIMEKNDSNWPRMIIYILCLSAFILIFYGFIIFENSLIEIMANNELVLGEQGLTVGIFAIILATLMILAGYPILIHLFKRAKV